MYPDGSDSKHNLLYGTKLYLCLVLRLIARNIIYVEVGLLRHLSANKVIPTDVISLRSPVTARLESSIGRSVHQYTILQYRILLSLNDSCTVKFLWRRTITDRFIIKTHKRTFRTCVYEDRGKKISSLTLL